MRFRLPQFRPVPVRSEIPEEPVPPLRLVSPYPRAERVAQRVILATLPRGAERCSLLDIGCGSALHTRQLPCESKVFLDVVGHPYAPEPFVPADAREFLRDPGRTYDIIVCLDMIEHLEREAGEELLRLITARACRLALFFTPLGPMMINPADPTGHRSGSWPEEFEAHGFNTLVFPRFHDPWIENDAWGAFYAWRWAREEPGALRSVIALAADIGLLTATTAIEWGAADRADHWQRPWSTYQPRLFRGADQDRSSSDSERA